MLVLLTGHVLFCFKEIQLPKSQSLIPVITSGKVSVGFLVQNLFKTIHVTILFCVLSLSPFLITEHVFVLFVCLLGFAFTRGILTGPQTLRTVGPVRELICLGRPLFPDVCRSAWHIQGIQQVHFQWRNEWLLWLSLSYQTCPFTYCLFPPFGKTSELLIAFFLCLIKSYFGEFMWGDLVLKWAPLVAQMVKNLPPMQERHGFDPSISQIPWRRVWLPTPVLLPGESHGQRNLVEP